MSNKTHYAVTDIAHPALRDVRDACQDCLDLAHDAAVTARVTGSVGSTYASGTHSATVKRAITVFTLGG